jgi:hypothetical protein
VKNIRRKETFTKKKKKKKKKKRRRGRHGKNCEADRKRSEHALAKVCSHTIDCSVCSLSSVSIFHVPLWVNYFVVFQTKNGNLIPYHSYQSDLKETSKLPFLAKVLTCPFTLFKAYTPN